MRRLSGLLVAGALMLLPAFSHGHGTAFAQQAPQKTTFTGDMVLWAFNVPADKATEYEAVMTKLKEALTKSERPDAKQQLAGWKVMKNAMPQPDGTLVYVHVINPVVKDADYSITNIVYEVFKDPAEQKTFYDQYRGAIKAALFIIEGPLTADFSK
ncbi:MAG: hypothetical protein HYY76_14800 [Acidobacteria bacterium]|nr:hypothetical protein [Acidobacteriota bacterium]